MMKASLYVAAVLVLPFGTLAGTYKCVGDGGAIEFSDKPCLGARSVEGVKIQDNRFSAPPAPARGGYGKGADPHVSQLDTLVTKAIANRDYAKARGLAVTREHWAMIDSAERADTQARSEGAKARAARRPSVCNTVGSSDSVNLRGGYSIGSFRGTTTCY